MSFLDSFSRFLVCFFSSRLRLFRTDPKDISNIKLRHIMIPFRLYIYRARRFKSYKLSSSGICTMNIYGSMKRWRINHIMVISSWFENSYCKILTRFRHGTFTRNRSQKWALNLIRTNVTVFYTKHLLVTYHESQIMITICNPHIM